MVVVKHSVENVGVFVILGKLNLIARHLERRFRAAARGLNLDVLKFEITRGDLDVVPSKRTTVKLSQPHEEVGQPSLLMRVTGQNESTGPLLDGSFRKTTLGNYFPGCFASVASKSSSF